MRLAEEIFSRSGHNYWALPHYFVLDLGFDVKFQDKTTIPAGAICRRAHRRPVEGDVINSDNDKYVIQERVELLLRRFGVTSTGSTSREVRTDEKGLAVFKNGRRLNYTEEQVATLAKKGRTQG